MTDSTDCLFTKNPSQQILVIDVTLIKNSRRINGRPMAFGQIVNDGHRMTAGQQGFDRLTADIAGAAGDKDGGHGYRRIKEARDWVNPALYMSSTSTSTDVRSSALPAGD